MQWHWGNIGAMLAGVSAIVVAVGALIRGPAVIRAWLDRQAADAEEARARAESLRGDAEERRLERRRTLLGWSPHGVETYTVALVTDSAEMDQAKAELTGGGPTGYVVLRVDEGEYTSPNRGRSLRMLIEEQRLLCRPPAAAEREALDAGFEALGVRDLPPGAAPAASWY
jgi:hypothetical protein